MEQYELNWKNYYGILGVSPGAEPEVIKAAYTALARKYHPDTGGSAQRMKEINESYEVLSDSLRKAQYDSYYRQKQASSTAGDDAHASGAGDTYKESQSDRQSGRSYQRSRTYQRKASGHTRTSYTGTGQGAHTGKRPGSRPANNPLYEDGNHKLMPWPSHRWQQAGLLGSVLIGIALAFMGPILWLHLAGIALAVMGTYSCIETRLVTEVASARKLARFSGIIAVTLALSSTGLAAAALAAAVVVAAAAIMAVVFIIRVLLRAGGNHANNPGRS